MYMLLVAAASQRACPSCCFPFSAHCHPRQPFCIILCICKAYMPTRSTTPGAAGALTLLVQLLARHKIVSLTKQPQGSGGVARRAADAITNLAHENVDIKSRVRQEGGIPPLVGLLEAWDPKVQRAAAGEPGSTGVLSRWHCLHWRCVIAVAVLCGKGGYPTRSSARLASPLICCWCY